MLLQMQFNTGKMQKQLKSGKIIKLMWDQVFSKIVE